MEGEADYKAELVDLAKDGICIYFFNPNIATKIFQFSVRNAERVPAYVSPILMWFVFGYQLRSP